MDQLVDYRDEEFLMYASKVQMNGWWNMEQRVSRRYTNCRCYSPIEWWQIYQSMIMYSLGFEGFCPFTALIMTIHQKTGQFVSLLYLAKTFQDMIDPNQEHGGLGCSPHFVINYNLLLNQPMRFLITKLSDDNDVLIQPDTAYYIDFGTTCTKWVTYILETAEDDNHIQFINCTSVGDIKNNRYVDFKNAYKIGGYTLLKYMEARI